MKILVISTRSLEKWNERNGTDLNHCDLTDRQFEEINAEFEGGWHFDSCDELVSEINAEGPCAPDPGKHYIRVIRTPETFFPITSVHRDDLEAAGFEVSGVSDETMERLAKRMADDYITQLFWTSLKITAEELNIPEAGKDDIPAEPLNESQP